MAFTMTLREMRADAELTQKQLAKLAGLDQTAISQLELGKVRDPQTSTVRALCRALDKSPADIESAIRESVKVAA